MNQAWVGGGSPPPNSAVPLLPATLARQAGERRAGAAGDDRAHQLAQRRALAAASRGPGPRGSSASEPRRAPAARRRPSPRRRPWSAGWRRSGPGRSSSRRAPTGVAARRDLAVGRRQRRARAAAEAEVARRARQRRQRPAAARARRTRCCTTARSRAERHGARARRPRSSGTSARRRRSAGTATVSVDRQAVAQERRGADDLERRAGRIEAVSARSSVESTGRLATARTSPVEGCRATSAAFSLRVAERLLGGALHVEVERRRGVAPARGPAAQRVVGHAVGVADDDRRAGVPASCSLEAACRPHWPTASPGAAAARALELLGRGRPEPPEQGAGEALRRRQRGGAVDRAARRGPSRRPVAS